MRVWRRIFWARHHQNPPRGWRSQQTPRCLRRSAPVPALGTLTTPRRRREHRGYLWRLLPIFEPLLKTRLPRGQSPKPLQIPGRRSHYPWVTLVGQRHGGFMAATGRENPFPRWRSGPAGATLWRHRRLQKMHLRLTNEPEYRFALNPTRSRFFYTGRRRVEERHWVPVLYSGVHAMRQMPRKR